MMNAVAVCLVLSSLVTAGVWSPSPEKQSPREDVIVIKEGHRVVVVEYEKQIDGKTKVSISPQETDDKSYISAAKEKLSTATKGKGAVEDEKEKAKEAASVLPNIGQGLSGSHPSPDHRRGHSPGELVCDALGKCKEKIASAVGKAKEKVFETAQEVTEKAQEIEEQAKEAVSEALGKAKETVSQKTDEISVKVREGAKEAVRDAKETVLDKAHRVEEGAKEMAAKAVDTSKTIGKDAKEQAKEKAKQAGEKAKQVTDTVKTGPKRLKEEGQKELKEILRRGRAVAYDVLTYAVSPRSMETLTGVVHLVGFSTAYGICMWVTFVSSYVLAEALPRQQFGMVQSKIYPVYFRTMAYCLVLGLLGHLLGQRKRLFSNKAEMLQGYNLLASLLMLLFNLRYLEPRAAKAMFERMKIMKEEGRGRDDFLSQPASSRVADPVSGRAAAPAATGAGTTTTTTSPPAGVLPERAQQEVVVKSRIVELSERLKKLNGYSSFLNILTLMALTWHLVYLGQRLHAHASQCCW